MPVRTQGSLLAGRYRVQARLGAGGMATVLLCRDERLGRQVAVKRLHADSPRDVEQRFVREAKLGASLNHPNLVSVFDTDTDDEGVLIVMEYVEGEALAQALRRGPLPPGRVAAIARDLGEALDHAHAHGVVHRDVKPGNVLLARDGATKLVDLGIAVSADHTSITRSGTVLGSAAYMAPEQLDGRAVGPAADVYALATVCFEALTGERARTGRTPMEIAHATATAGPPDLREHAPALPAAAADALARGMAREPADRQRSAGALARELASALERPPAPEPPTTRALPVQGPAARPSRAGAALALGLLALAVAAVAAAVLVSRGGDGGQEGPRAERPAQERQTEAKPTESQEPAPATPGQSSAGDRGEEPPNAISGSQLNDKGFALMNQGDFAAAVPVLERAVASWPPDARDITYAYALFNLGQSLNRSGRPDEAIPFLEKRLSWDNQRDAVQAELDLARKNAGQG